jgi:hypothetical protein
MNKNDKNINLQDLILMTVKPNYTPIAKEKLILLDVESFMNRRKLFNKLFFTLVQYRITNEIYLN